MICAHQTKDRLLTPNKKIDIAIFDNLDLRKDYVEIDGQRYPRDGVSMNYTENDYIDQYRDSKLFFHEYIGELLLNPFTSYPELEKNYPMGIIDLSFQPDHRTPKKKPTISRIWR